MGVNVLSWAELKAWTELTDNHPTPFEIHVLKLIDIEYVNAQQTKKGDKG